jgi:hypothetical protein
MAARPSIVFLLAGAFLSLGASYPTQNFLVEAPTPQIAEQVGQAAERYRREKALQWLGQEMRPWGTRCPLRVTLTMNGSGGATTFQFDRGAILTQDMHIEGTLDRLLASVLPHEITHTVLAYYFRCPLPRWADEGGSVLSEDDLERSRHDSMVRQMLRSGQAMPLRRLFALRDYPERVMVLYAEGYSVTSFLVGLSNRSVFLAFVAHGMRGDWDGACRRYYRFSSVEELERAWVQSLRAPRGQELLAGNHNRPEGTLTAQQHVMMRQTAPPILPVLSAPQPIVRGQAPEAEYRPAPPPQPAYPSFPGQAYPPPPSGSVMHEPVRLGAPQYSRGAPPNSSPIGYSP